MGVYIDQDNSPAAFRSCQLNDAQLKHAVGDKELISTIMVLTEFCTIFLDAEFHIQIDHLNITTNDCVICWLDYVEQVKPYIHFNPGKDNLIADMLSWLDCLEESVLS